jgi:hypothetical protein
MSIQLWGPIFDLTGNGGFKAFSHSWVFIKAANLVEVILVVLLFVVGMFVNIPGREIEPREAPPGTPSGATPHDQS